MGNIEWIPSEPVNEETEEHALERLLEQPRQEPKGRSSGTVQAPYPIVGVFQGFNLEDSPLVTLPPVLPGGILTARSTVPLTRDRIGAQVVVICEEGDPYRAIIVGVFEENHHRVTRSSDPAQLGVVTGMLIGFQDQGLTPLVMFPGQIGTAAVAARATQDLHAAHIGRQVVLLFEGGDPRRPIIVGCIQQTDARSPPDHASHVEVEADGARLIVSAKGQLVLQCGKASITLTKAGKVLIHGTYVSTHSSGAHRIKGGSVQIN